MGNGSKTKNATKGKNKHSIHILAIQFSLDETSIKVLIRKFSKSWTGMVLPLKDENLSYIRKYINNGLLYSFHYKEILQ